MCKENLQQKTFSSFNTIDEVCELLGYEYEKIDFVEEKHFELNDFFKKNLIEDFSNSRNFTSEIVICESLIKPIISIVSKVNNLPLWSHIKFEYDKELGLTGEPDYIWGIPTIKNGAKLGKPIVCLGEAKKDDFIKGWAQVSAEMIAAQKFNDNSEIPILGLVSNAKNWEFAKLKGKMFTLDTRPFSSAHLNEVFNVLNWFLAKARKNADMLEN